jgi:hypothetical protein
LYNSWIRMNRWLRLILLVGCVCPSQCSCVPRLTVLRSRAVVSWYFLEVEELDCPGAVQGSNDHRRSRGGRRGGELRAGRNHGWQCELRAGRSHGRWVSSARGICRWKDSADAAAAARRAGCAVALKPANFIASILCEFSMISNELLVICVISFLDHVIRWLTLLQQRGVYVITVLISHGISHRPV